ncbi:MAG TPA: rifamycin-inactivating phosphotransferase [Acidimicrobiales bacterium]
MSEAMSNRYVLGLEEVDRAQVALVGGKGAHLGELARIEGVRVPAGFCVTTEAFQRVITEASSIDDQLDRLARLDPGVRGTIPTLSAELRRVFEGIAIPDDVSAAITRSLARLGERAAYAVRSSATAEDLPTASFAGQQETYLNVVGPAAIFEHITRCWASLFTERAVTYRLRNGIDHRAVHMAVVVQQMVFPEASGVLFTADPVTSNRTIACVEASFGLGEALVSGLVNPDRYEVRDDVVTTRLVATKRLAVRPLPAGGVEEIAIDPERQEQAALTDAQVVQLARLGRRIEAHFGQPQDIEWCLVDDGFQVVQSRPITTLFPVPATDDGRFHVFVSVGHGQMMTDAMKPFGISMWQLTALPRMYEAGGRLFVDVTERLASPASRANLLEGMGRGDPLIRDALETVLERGDYVPSPPDEDHGGAPAGGAPATLLETDPAIVEELMASTQASIAALQRDIRTRSGPGLIEFILADIQELRRILFDPRSHQVFMSAMEATWWLNDQLEAWLGEGNAADTLTRSVPYNVTSEMGLALLDVADAIRPHPEVVDLLQRVDGDDAFLAGLERVAGGREAGQAIRGFLDRYGMRCIGEIDITRPRWSERPATLVPMILGNVRNFEPGAGRRRFEEGLREAQRKEQNVLERLRALPDGEQKATESKQKIDRVRTFIGYREYPKYGMVSRYFVYKLALLEEADRLVQAGVLRHREDIFHLTFDELRDVVSTNRLDAHLISERKDAFVTNQSLTAPRVLTSEGDALAGAYRRRDVPAGALVGVAVSIGTVEGRARVVLDMADADLEPGDILVTAYTDPSWTPAFVAISALVTEVGGLMTHGAVVAREYGLPAVVGVEHATRLIRDGERIRVHGTSGYVEILA